MKKILRVNFFLIIVSLLSVDYVLGQRFSTPSEIIGFCEKVEDENRLVGFVNPDSIPSLPIGLHKEIGGVKYTIAIDSARFLTNGAFFDAYMAIQLPGASQKIAFRASNIQFNSKGVIAGAHSRLSLVSDQDVKMGPELTLNIPGDGSNYVEWDCNGFKAVNIHGIFKFSEELLIPTDESPNVQAEFEIYTSDISDILIETSITPFKLKGNDEFEFFIEEATLDLSDLRNPISAVFPNHYHEIYPEEILLWRGFYLKSIRIFLPKALKNKGERIEVGANNLFIDNSGFSGELFINNLLSFNEGDMSGWSFSVDTIRTHFVNNQLVGGGIAGSFGIPAIEQTNFQYAAGIYENGNGGLDYNFLVSFDEVVKVQSAHAEFELDPSTYFQVQIIDDKFLPKLVTTGAISIKRGSTEILGLDFQDITFETKAPYITNGIFSLTGTSDTNKMENFSIQIEEFFIHFSETSPVFGLRAQLNLSSSGSSSNQSGFSLSVQGGFRIHTKIINLPAIDAGLPSKQKWSIDRFAVSDIGVDVQRNALTFKGNLSFKQNDPTYGNGFSGSMLIKVQNVLDDPLSATFFAGKVDGYRYWFVDISLPIKIPLGNTGANINKIRGGASFHVRDTRTKEELIASANQGAYVPLDTYVPDRSIGLMLKAGVGLDWVNPTVLNADVLFSITFNSTGGLNEVYFLGKVFCMVPRQARFTGDNKVEGTILVHYDNVEKILDAQVEAEANFSNVIKGNLNLHVFISPDIWFFKLNSPSNPAYVNLMDFAFIHTYLMVGKQLEPMLPPPPTVSNLVGIENASSRDQEAILLGNGFAHGSRIQVGGELAFGWSGFAIYGALDVGAGYDITMYNYGPSARCEGRSGQIGMKGWYLQGQIYAYIGFAVGIRGKIMGTNYDIPLLEAYLAMYLAGKLPKPTYVEGGVGVSATLLGFLKVNFHANFALGEDCNIITT